MIAAARHLLVASICGVIAALATTVHDAPAALPRQHAVASAYGPGLYGNHTACGQRLYADTVGVASRSYRCGTSLLFLSRAGRWVPARVIDRGPFVGGRSFDLTNGLVRQLGYGSCRAWGVRTVTWRRA